MTHRVEHLRVIKQALDVRERDLEHQTDALSLKKLAEIANAKAFVYLEIGRVLNGGKVVRNYPGVSSDQQLQRQIAQHVINHEALVVAESNPRPLKRLRTQTLTGDQLGPEGSPAEASVFVGIRNCSALCSLCTRADEGYLFCGTSLILRFERDAFIRPKSFVGDVVIKHEPQSPFLSLCSWCAIDQMNTEWSANREWMCVDNCAWDRWESVPRGRGWNLTCSVFRHTNRKLTGLLYKTGEVGWILWVANKAGKFTKPRMIWKSPQAEVQEKACEIMKSLVGGT